MKSGNKMKNSESLTNMEILDQEISNSTKETAKQVLQMICDVNDGSEQSSLLIGKFINKIASLGTETSNELSKHLNPILIAIQELETPIPVLFILLEHFTQKRDEIERLKLFEIITKLTFPVSYVIGLLYKENSDAVVLDLLKHKNDLVDCFIREAVAIENPTVSKNLAAVLPCLECKYFVNYNSFLFLFDCESHYTRNCLLEIFQNLIFSFKEDGNIDAIRELTRFVSERLCDTNFYVRSKAISVIGELFRAECVLKDQRNSLIKETLERVRDKTVIVRKKTINLLGQILLNHPFKDKPFLIRTDIKNKSAAGEKMHEDFIEFIDIMEDCLTIITSLLEYDLKTDIQEISTFIKVAYLFKLQGSREAIHKMLGLVFTKDKQIIIDVFREILTNRAEILYEFIGDSAFETILYNLDIDKKELIQNIFNNINLSESLYVFKHSRKTVSESFGLSLLEHITEVLFKSKDEQELEMNLKSYVNALHVVRRMEKRIDSSNDIFTLINKNVIKMVFYDKTVIKQTVDLIYSISNNPEKTVGKLLKNLCLSKSLLKMLDACGVVAMNQYKLLERLEKALKGGNAEGRSSLGSSSTVRKSFEGMKAVKGLREKRKSLEDNRRLSIGKTTSIDRLSLQFDELNEMLKNKTDEEIADFFFYLKEREMLYAQTSMLHQIVDLLVNSLNHENSEVQMVAYTSLFKCMLVSSEFFTEHKHRIETALNHQSVSIKNAALVALHDFLIYYNTSLDFSLLFDQLRDPRVSKNALLLIFDLLQKNIIRIKNNSVLLVSLLFNDELGVIVKTLVQTFCSNCNMISTLFYETYTSELSVEYVEYLAPFIPQSIQESMFIKCLKANLTIERLKIVFDRFELNEKFIKENLFRDEIRQLVPQIAECV